MKNNHAGRVPVRVVHDNCRKALLSYLHGSLFPFWFCFGLYVSSNINLLRPIFFIITDKKERKNVSLFQLFVFLPLTAKMSPRRYPIISWFAGGVRVESSQ